jgi:hypothetical protein
MGSHTHPQDMNPGDRIRWESEQQMSAQERAAMSDTQHRLATSDWKTPDRRQ